MPIKIILDNALIEKTSENDECGFKGKKSGVRSVFSVISNVRNFLFCFFFGRKRDSLCCALEDAECVELNCKRSSVFKRETSSVCSIFSSRTVDFSVCNVVKPYYSVLFVRNSSIVLNKEFFKKFLNCFFISFTKRNEWTQFYRVTF